MLRRFGPSLLLRVYFETADGGYYSPMFEDCFEALPVPEFLGRLTKVDYALNFTYDKVPSRCGSGGLGKYIPTDYLLVGGSSYPVSKVIAHYDPRLDIGVYSDYWRSAGGRIPKALRCEGKDTFLFFAAGLAKYPPKFFNSKHGFTEIRRVFMRSNRGIYVVGYMKVDEIADLTQFSSKITSSLREGGIEKVWEEAVKAYGERVIKTPHYARPVDLPVVILSEEGHYGFFREPIPLIEWVGKKRVLSKYSYMFGIMGSEDRVRQKVFSDSRTEEIVRTLERDGFLST
ncbi:MAG: hypothetical protein J7L55_03795 [Desulfurococcales archaeon]|nr:hypothetical protein [Desulfurococcales archaeon]